MRKSYIILLLMQAALLNVHGQSVGIGTTTPNAAAQLDITSTAKGVLIPRMTDAQKNAITSPVQGLMVYNINTNSFQYFTGTAWNNMSHSGIVNGTANKVAKFNSPWGLAANGLITDNGSGVSINTTNALPGSSALLDIESSNKGVLIPRMTTAQRTAIAAPVNGLLVFDNTSNSFWFYKSNAWTELSGGSGNSTWNLADNNIYSSNAGNAGIGTSNPVSKLQVQGSLVVNAPTSATSTPPTVAQTKTMPGLGTLTFLLSTDSTGRLYDAGGPSGNYGIDHDGKAIIAAATNIAIEATAETMNLSTGDSLIIKDRVTGARLLAVGNGYNTTGRWVFNYPSLEINFKSNTDFNTGAGFSLLFRRLYDNSSSLAGISGAAGNALFFDAKNGSFQSGNNQNSKRGDYSTAMGFEVSASGTGSTAMGHGTIASGDNSTAIGIFAEASGFRSFAIGSGTTASGTSSTAMGEAAIASGSASTAMGYSTNAIGNNSTAMGNQTSALGYASVAAGLSSTASGDYSIAMGYSTTASGARSVAMGSFTTASGDFSTALGSQVSTNGQEGSLVIGDHSTTTIMNGGANTFRARFAGGYRFYTSAAITNVESCVLPAGGNAWTTVSDFRLKEKFQQSDGEDFLNKIAAMQLGSWNYKTQNPTTYRHYGPMAQDFFAAFGKDNYGIIGNDTTINSADFAGVSLIAIQALEKRTQRIEELEKENALLKNDNADIKAMLLQLRKEMDELKMKNILSAKSPLK